MYAHRIEVDATLQLDPSAKKAIVSKLFFSEAKLSQKKYTPIPARPACVDARPAPEQNPPT
ncbi:hypothetical protein D3C72_2527280 [compost metagenome]